ncbi:MAG TPA: excinuclease ABC subunit UvrA, partial [Archangium sp.]
RVRLDGEVKTLDDPKLVPAGTKEIAVDLVVDRLVAAVDQRSRIADSLELAFREGKDRAIVLAQKSSDAPWRELHLSQSLACEICGDVFEKLTPRHFSFNHRDGACPTCDGLGKVMKFVPELIVADPEKSIREGALKPWRIGGKNLIIKHNALLKQLAEQLPYDPETPWKDLPESTRNTILFGAGERRFAFKLKRMREAKDMPFPGVIADLEESFRHTDSEGFRARLTTFMISGECPECHGTRLNARSGHVRVRTTDDATGCTFPEFMAMDVLQTQAFAKDLVARHGSNNALREVVTGVEQRLHFLLETGLGYLTLERDYGTLSGGEAQRVRLATQLGMGLIGVIYVLDEPSIGLHPHDNQKLLETIVALRDRGNTVLVVEHDEDTMRLADELIEMGPEAGTEGGQILFQGTPEACMKLPPKATRTGPYLARTLSVTREAKPKKPDGAFLTVREARANNLRGIDAKFPVGLLTCVTGVSGSGKSTLVNDILAVQAARKLNGARTLPAKHRHIENLDFFEKLVQVDQEPIGRSPRSNPASYVDLLPL